MRFPEPTQVRLWLEWDSRTFITSDSVRLIPVVLCLPAMIFPVPPLVVFVPAPLALGVQIASPVVSLMTVLAMVANCFVQICLGFFDGVLAFRSVIGLAARRGYEQQES